MSQKLIALFLVSTLSFSVYAEDKRDAKDHPCNKIKTACMAAGYKQGEHKNKKGIQLDCMQPIVNGEKIKGVNVSSEDIATCKIKLAELKAKKAAKKAAK